MNEHNHFEKVKYFRSTICVWFLWHMKFYNQNAALYESLLQSAGKLSPGLSYQRILLRTLQTVLRGSCFIYLQSVLGTILITRISYKYRFYRWLTMSNVWSCFHMQCQIIISYALSGHVFIWKSKSRYDLRACKKRDGISNLRSCGKRLVRWKKFKMAKLHLFFLERRG